ncbi:hypothetical protein NW622_004882 [Vibrio alginolyticus]|nr:hypothetical protein [Vibrio alginolyticus]
MSNYLELLTLFPISISLISLIISWLAYRQGKMVRIEDEKTKLYEKLLDVALLAESNVQLLTIVEHHTPKLFPNDPDFFKENCVNADKFKKDTRDLIEQVRSIKTTNRKKVKDDISNKYHQACDLFVSTKSLNNQIIRTSKTIEAELSKR